MAMAFRTLMSKPSLWLSSLFPSRSFASKSLSFPLLTRPSPLVRLRPLTSLAEARRFPDDLARFVGLRCFSTRPTTSSLNDSSPNWSNRPPKETILLDGCDFEHWLVVMEPPEGNPTRDEIIDSYIKTLSQVVGSEDEAKMKIYTVSTRCYYAFGALVSEEVSLKIKALPKVRWVLPDSYLDVKNKDYGGEPFIDGKAVPYDPKYHEEWIRNNARANERSRRNDRPRNYDRSRNFERRRENIQNRDFQSRDVPPMPNKEFQNRDGGNVMPPRDMPSMPNHEFHNQNTMPPRDMPNVGAMPIRDVPPGAQYLNRDGGSMPNRDFQGRDGPNRDLGGMPDQMPNYQSSQMLNRDGGNMPSGNVYQSGGAYPGSGNTHQGGSGFQGSVNTYQGGGGTSPGSGYAYQGGGGASPGSGNAYQGGGGTHQGGGYTSQGGVGAYQGGGNEYQGRDMPPMPNRQYQ